MEQDNKLPVNIEDEMKRSYLDYAMSVIIGRALPDVRDGLKPVHRRVLWAMNELSNTYNKPYKKSARVVGDVIGKYHPHGDVAVYDTIVRLAQDFSMRTPLIDGQGNFGCFTGDTKIKLVDGTEKSFAELANLNPDEKFYVYSVDQNGRIVIGEGKHSRITRKQASLIEINLDNGRTIRCTPDHLFMLRDGNYKEALDLTPEDSLMPGYFEEVSKKIPTSNLTQSVRILQPKTGKYEFATKTANVSQQEEVLSKSAKTYNHRIVSNKLLEEKADVYDITVDIHHNFLLADGVFVHNSVDGDAPAAMRYTEIRMAKVSDMMLADIDKETVDFHPNYDETMVEPVVLPARFPNLLVNGSSGIAVGMATNIPPHNLTEILEATILLVQKPETQLEEILKIVPGPDFPTGAFIFGREGIKQAYETGRGSVIMRARAAIDRSTRNESRESIVVTQIPYQVNKAKLIERIAELINDKKIEDISDLRDESDREGMRIVIELKRGAVAQVVLNNLYKLTAMQTSFGIINLSIVAGQPKVLGIIETLRLFINFRKEVVRRRTEFELRKAKARQHILLGLIKALDHLDEVIKLIRASRSSAEAKEGLITKFEFSALQAQAILDLQLHRLTGLEKEKIVNELKEVERRIKELEDILNNETTLKTLIIKELREVQKDFGNERRTQILDAEADLKLEDLIPDEDMVITVTLSGYVKRTPLAHYRSQRRGGTGKRGMTTRTEDIVSHIFIASNHSYILIFSDKGQAYTLKVHEIPDVSASGKGKAIVNLINLPGTEKVAGILTIREFAKDQHVVMVTRRGTIKKTELADFAYSRARGILAIGIDEGDELIATELSDGKKKIFIATHNGMAIYFNESDVRSMGRQAYGVKGIDLRENDYVVGVAVVNGTEQMLTVSQYGLGKRTTLEDYRFQSRGGIGVINMKVTDKTGCVVGVMPVQDDDELILISSQGKVIRFDVKDIRETGRNTQGVKLIDTADDDYVASASLIERQDSPILEPNEKQVGADT